MMRNVNHILHEYIEKRFELPLESEMLLEYVTGHANSNLLSKCSTFSIRSYLTYTLFITRQARYK